MLDGAPPTAGSRASSRSAMSRSAVTTIGVAPAFITMVRPSPAPVNTVSIELA